MKSVKLAKFARSLWTVSAFAQMLMTLTMIAMRSTEFMEMILNVVNAESTMKMLRTLESVCQPIFPIARSIALPVWKTNPAKYVLQVTEWLKMEVARLTLNWL